MGQQAAILVCLLTVPLLASHIADTPATHAPDARKHPKYKVEVRQRNSSEVLPDLDSESFYKTHPYAALRPQPFFYKEDEEKDKANAFLVAGVNCDAALASCTQITGVSIDHLNKRAHAPVVYNPEIKGTFPFHGTPQDKLPEWWRASQNIHMRASSDGFITEKQDLRKLLIADNRAVRKLHLNHQLVASPLLTGIELLKKGEKKAASFESGGDSFTVAVKSSGSAIRLQRLVQTPEEAEQNAYIAKHGTVGGWVGAGVQGSFFNDDLYADDLIEFTRMSDGKSFIIDGVTPHLIYRYGFYQGGQYRHGPDEIASYFKLKGKPEDDSFAACPSSAIPRGHGTERFLSSRSTA